MVDKTPNLFIVGAPKCGTSFLYEYLKGHPEVFMSSIKEPNFFDQDLHYVSNRFSLEQYLELFKGVKNEKVIGEASPYYLYSSQAPKLIYEFNSKAKIIIMLREPVSMMYALHGEHLYQGNEIEEDFEKALKLEDARKNGINRHVNSNPAEGIYYKEIADYGTQIQRYYSIFDRENILVILLDDVKENPEEVYRKVLSFLNISTKVNVDFKVVNESKTIKSKTLREFVKRPPATLQRIIRFVIPIHSLRVFILESIININTKTAKRDPIRPELTNTLKLGWKDKIISLGSIINRDLQKWM